MEAQLGREPRFVPSRDQLRRELRKTRTEMKRQRAKLNEWVARDLAESGDRDGEISDDLLDDRDFHDLRTKVSLLELAVTSAEYYLETTKPVRRSRK